MPTSIQIQIAGQNFQAELNDSETAQQVLAALPLTAKATRWGDEFYFAIPVHQPEAADAQAEVEVGDLAYWPPGNAFCIFFGPTPVSRGNEPRAYSPVNRFGRLLGEISALHTIANGSTIRVSR